MTVHVLHAGDGYTYLTRQVACGDHVRERGQELVDYYTAEGNPPGRWLGEGLGSLEVAGPVREEQMRALFGEGLHPDADRIIAERTELYVRAGAAADAAAGAAQQDARLGRRFPQFEPDNPWREQLKTRYRQEADRLGLASSAQLSEEQRAELRQAYAVETYTARHGHEPKTAAALRAWVAQQSRPPRQPVAGYDLVFTPVKSVSVVWALGNDQIRREVEQAHGAAMLKALSYVQEHAARTRVGAGGVAQIDTHGLVVAAFDHRDSRAGDPGLHTHCAVSTKVQGSDGKWRSLDGRVLFALAVSASETYNTAIEDELRARLGVRFVERSTGALDKRPVREIEGVEPALLAHFARRRAAVEELYAAKAAAYRDRYGHEPPRSAQARMAQEATLESRAHKAPPKSLRDQRREWLTAAQSVLGGVDEDAVRAHIEAVTGRRHSTTEPERDNDAWARRVLGRVETDRSTWTRWHVQAEAERQLRGLPIGPAARADLVGDVTRRALEVHSLRLAAPRLEAARPAALTRDDGTSVFQVHGAQRFSSQRILDAEQALLEAAHAPARSTITPGAVAAAVRLHQSEGRPLDPGQVTLADRFATAPRRVAVGIGPAGTGKTTAMRLLVDAAAMSGTRVIALAPSAVAADVLGTELGVRADTVHKLLHTLENQPDQVDVRAGDILLVDEAGMVGTLQLQQLVDLAIARDAQVRLLGDPQQLAAVESGGALRLLEQDADVVHLEQVHRFVDPAEADASLLVRAGDTAALAYYENAGRVHGASREGVVEEVLAAWAADDARGRTALMVASRLELVSELSARARLQRASAGRIDLAGPVVALHDGTEATVGDLVVTRRNDRRITVRGGRDWVKNGDVWRVVAVGPDGDVDVQHCRHQGRATLPAHYVREVVELGYATTVHRAQGVTSDTCHVVVEESMSRQALYVAATRGRHANQLYAVTDQLLDLDLHHPPGQEATAREVLESVLRRDGAERSATETLREELSESISLRRLVPQYEHAVDRAAQEKVGDLVDLARAGLGEDLARQVTTDDAWPALRAVLAAGVLTHPTGAAGAAADLRRASTERETTSAGSLAQVLTWRLTRARHHASTARAAQAAGLPSWLPAVAAGPPALSGPGTGGRETTGEAELRRWLEQRQGSIRARVDQLVAAYRARPPAWADAMPDTTATGEPLLRDVLAYREQWAVEDEVTALGARPQRSAGAQRRVWEGLDARLREVRADTSSPPRGRSLDQTSRRDTRPERRHDDLRPQERRGGPRA